MDNKKLNYTAPFTRNLDTYFEGVICASGAASGVRPLSGRRRPNLELV